MEIQKYENKGNVLIEEEKNGEIIITLNGEEKFREAGAWAIRGASSKWFELKKQIAPPNPYQNMKFSMED